MRQQLASPERAARSSFGWVVVAAAFVLLIGSFGTQLTFGVFLKPLSEDFLWSRAATAGAMSLMMGVSGVIGVIMGRVTDRYNVRAVIALGGLVGALGYLLLTILSSLWQFYVFFGVATGICLGCTYAPVNATISKWFPEKNALALGVALMGITVGQMVLSPVVAHVIATMGWRTAYVMLAIIVIACAVPAVILLGRVPPVAQGIGIRRGLRGQTVAAPRGLRRARSQAAPLEGYTVGEAARAAPFWMLMVTGFVISAGFYIVAAHIVPCANDLGISATLSALVLTVSSVGGIAGTLLAWPLTVRLGGRYALFGLILGEAAAMFLFMVTESAWAFYLVAVLFGFSFGAASPVRMAMVPPLFGLRAVGAILGWATFAWSLGGIAGPYLAGAVYDAGKSYDLAFLAGGMLLVIGAATVLVFGSHRRGDRRWADAAD
jgi:MFS family permease